MSKRRNKKNPANSRRAAKRQRGKANLHYKDTVFRMLFQDKKRLLGLYNAISGQVYGDPEMLNIVMLESAVYLGMKNDLAFLIDMRLYLFEHQSTVNNNMPLRFLQYVSAEYEKLIVSQSLYQRAQVKIPAPHFIVFYNGVDKYAEYSELRLSASYEVQEENPELELRVQVLNINAGYNEELKEACRTLKEYMQYVDKVRAFAKDMNIDEAVDRAVDECIEQDILREFLLANKAEVKHMSIFEYNEEDVRQVIREESYEEGRETGRIEGKIEDILDLLKEKGTVPEELEKRITSETEEDILRKWLKLAGSVKNVEGFIKEGFQS